MSGNFAIKGGGVGPLMANAILNFHFDYLNPSLITCVTEEIQFSSKSQVKLQVRGILWSLQAGHQTPLQQTSNNNIIIIRNKVAS